MAKKKTTEKALNIDNILFNCRDYLRAARNSGSFFEKRDMMLTLVFLRFIGEKYEDGIENLKQTLKEQGLDPEDENIRAAFFDDATFADGTYNLPPEARWSTIISTPAPQLNVALDTALQRLEEEDPQLKGCFVKGTFTARNLAANDIKKIVDEVNKISHKTFGEEKDLIGRVYEYFLKEFAVNATKEEGEFYTPHDVVQLIATMIEPYDGTLYDPCCGSGGMFIQSAELVKSKQGNLNGINVYGQEKEPATYRLAKMNLALRGISHNLGEEADSSFTHDLHKEHTNDRYYITRKKYRTVNGKGFFEYTLSYAQEEITKFDRFVAYSFNDIPDNYSIQCDFYQSNIDFNGVGIDIKCLIAWNVAIRPCELEKLARICGYDIVVKSDNLYYKALMKFLSRTGMNLLDILLADNEEYEIYIQQIELSKKTELKDTFDKIREVIIKEKPGSNILRYITAYLKNDVIRDQLADRTNNLLSYLYLKNEAIPFDEMPYASSLCGHNLSKLRLHKCLEIYDCECQYVSSMVNKEAYDSNILYVIVDHDKLDYYQYEVGIFNNNLYNSKKQQLRKIDTFANHLYVKNYYETTKSVIEKLQKYTLERIDVYSDMIDKQADFMQEIDDDNKRKIVANIYMNSKLGMIYGAAGTGKTRVAEYIAKIFEDKNILLLANTNAAKNNLERRIKSSCDCYTVYDYLKNGYSWKKYDLVILDECSTVCNEDVLNLFEKCNAEAYLLIGDIYQIEAIKFGNWFNFARYFVDKKSVYELVTPYRAKDKSILLDMWTCVRNFDENMFERLLANGFISTLNESIFERDDDEIVLCLGYDGLYGVNNINRYMQKINPSKPIEWGNWTYKVGDKVLFNESRRFGNVLYNNLKGSILSIDKKTDEIVFQILVDKIISERDVLFSDIKLIDCDCEGKSIVEFSVKRRVERDSDSDYSEQIVPFQIAYAVSIHKAQGLEYKSVKVVITEDIDEKISHNIFYTAITRTTDKLKIYMSKETQKKLAEKFVKSNVGLKQAQLFAGQAGLKLKNKLSS